MAGTTAICCLTAGQLSLFSSKKNQDADQFIFDHLASIGSPLTIYIDAPLSLPGVYSGLDGYQDYFYRKSDKAVKAMSPMFLGGLTARAMKLKSILESNGHKVLEAYPGGYARLNDLKSQGYKSETDRIPTVAQMVMEDAKSTLNGAPKSWHEVDALIAYRIGEKHQSSMAEMVGDEREGIILF